MINNLENEIEYVYTKGEVSGPLSKILSLIEERKLHISDVALAEIAEDFIVYTKSLPISVDIRPRISFITTASILVLIKSKSLLPNLALTDEESEKIDDLKYRLFLLNNIKNASDLIEKSFANTVRMFGRQSITKDPVFTPHESLNINNILLSINEALERVPEKKEALPNIEIVNVVSIEEMIESLEERVLHGNSITFKSKNSSLSKEEKLSTIVTFLAMLELLRQGLIDVKEDDRDEYIISKDSQSNESGE
ncbi:segregation/condensation protein A [Candidatus Nomurabacteria bacterium]|nr:segregation/condensation protein A [Candidatus Nomurabacteria bacterium]